jgi:flavin-binding protein dodecin
MAEPFKTSDADDAGLIGRVFGSRARGAASREIEALLAAAPRVTDVSAAEVQIAGKQHAVDVTRHLRAPCLGMYRRYLEHCFVDRTLSDDEVHDLAHLRELFCLEEAACKPLHDEVAVALYGAAVDEALADHRLDPDEEEFLSRLKADLRLEEESAQQALTDSTRKARNRYLATATTAEGAIVAAKEAVVELEGSSSESIEDAVGDALGQASTLLSDIPEVEITKLTARLDDSRLQSWHVTVRGKLPRSR